MATAYYNGRVYTGALPLCEAFLAENGRILQTGSTRDILAALRSGDDRFDLEGCFVCPGFNDSHMHLLGFGNALRTAPLAAHTGSLGDMLACLRSFLAAHPPAEGQWLLGRGWNQDLFSDVNRMPDRHDLDSVSPHVPILVTRACGHCCVLNTAALRIAGIGPGTPDPSGGAIGREGGEPDGRLYDNAIELASRAVAAPGPAELRERLLAAGRELNRYGITSVQTDDYQVFPDVSWQAVNGICRGLADRRELTVRVCEQAQFTDPVSLRGFLDAGFTTGTGTDAFRIGPLKLVADGSLGSRTAFLSRPYADSPDTRGFPLFSDEALYEMIALAHSRGMQVAVHAIGDACLDQVLDAFDRALKAWPRPDCRHGIVHCQVTRPDQLARIRSLGLRVWAQSIFLDYDNHIVEKRAGSVLAASSYHWKTLMDSGVSVSNGSDCPVELPDVMAGIRCAVTRTSRDGTGPYLPGQAFTVQEALDSFTVRGAEATFEEGFKGRLAPGYLADFTVLAENPFETDPARLHEIRVVGCHPAMVQAPPDPFSFP